MLKYFIFKTQPSTEDFQLHTYTSIGDLHKDKAELIEYVKKLRDEIDNIESLSYIDSALECARDALSIPQPKCMDNE